MEKKYKILLVDDDPSNLELLDLCLCKKEFHVFFATNGEAAIKQVHYSVPDLVLLDVRMPGMDGYEVCRRLKAGKHSKDIPVIFISGLHETLDKVQGFKAGGVDYLTKPFQGEEVLARVQLHLQIQEMQKQLKTQNVRLQEEISQRKEAQTSLKKINAELEVRVDQRTADLTTVNKKLEESEAYFREFVEGTDNLVTRINDKGFIVYVNHVARKVFGLSPEECIGLSAFSFTDARDHDLTRHWFAECMRNKVSNASVENRQLSRNGEVRYMIWTVNFHYNKQGHIEYFNSIARDITERKEAEEERERLISAIEQSAESIVITDTKGTIQYVNPSFGRITGYTKEEVIGQNHNILKSDEQDETFYRKMWAILLHGNTWKGKIINKKKDGTLFTEEATISPVFDGFGQAVNYVMVKRDITAEIKMEDQLRQVQKMEAIGSLASGIAHDFNNILSPIMGYTELLKADIPQDSPYQVYIDAIMTASFRSRDLINQILTFSRQGVQKMMPIRLQPILKEALKLIRASIPTTIEIQQDIHTDCGTVYADPIQIHQIVMNLCTNAYHAMEKSGGKLKVMLKQIRIESGQSLIPELTIGEYAFLNISDTGTGMEKYILDKIFDPYFTTKEVGKGTGLGLSVVQGIVRDSNGHIKAFSEPGKRTEIHVYLPIIKTATKSRPSDTGQIIKGNQERILLVDDEEAIVSMEQMMLERLGYQVTPQINSNKALEAFKKNPDRFDLIITDLTMPNMTGTQLALEIKKIRPDIPVIICTGFSGRINDEKYREMGIEALIGKPILKRKMAQAIQNALGKT